MNIFKNKMARIITASVIGVLFLLAGIETLHAQQPTITATLKAVPESYSGKCPTTIKFEGEIKVTNIMRPPLKVQYKFIRSDGAFAPVQTLDFQRDGVKKVSDTWTLGGPGLPTYSGWEAIKIVYPQDVESNKANFKIECKAETKPTDLTIKIAQCPKSAKAGQDLGKGFQVIATNHGDTAVKDIAVDIVLRSDTSCPTPAPYAVYSPNYSNGVLLKGGREHVSLTPGQTLDVKLNGTNTIPADTPAGNYYLCAVIDAGNKVSEPNEGNNCACCPLSVSAVEGKADLTIPSVKFEKVESRVDVQNQPYWIFNVLITVKNQGTAAAGPFKVLLERNIGPAGTYTIACQTCEIDVAGLAAGQTLTLPPRQFNNANKMNSLFRATADSKNTIVESNETNNMNAEGFTP